MREPESKTPHSRTTEGMVIAQIIASEGQDLNYARKVLDPTDFYFEQFRTVFGVLLDMGGPIHSATLLETLIKRGLAAKAKLTEILQHDAIGGPAFASNVRRVKLLSASRRTHSTARRITKDIEDADSDTDYQELLSSSAYSLLESLRPVRAAINSQCGRESLVATASHMREQLDKPAQYFSTIATGVRELDEIGEIPIGTLTIIGARPRVGKTSFKHWLMVKYAKRGYRVHSFNLEDTTRREFDRMLVQQSRLMTTRDLRRLVFGDPSADPNGRRQIKEQLHELAKLPITQDDSTGLTVDDIRALTLQEVEENEVQVVFVDHLLEIKAPKWGRGYEGARRHAIDYSLEGLRDLAKDLNIAVVALTQIHRVSTSKQQRSPWPALENLKESGKIEEVARFVWLLHRPESDRVWRERVDWEHPLGIRQAKATEDAQDGFWLMFDPKYTAFRIPDEDEAEKAADAEETGGWYHEMKKNRGPF